MENYGKYMQVLNLIKLFHTQRGNGIQSIKQNRENCRCGCSRCILIINFLTLVQNPKHALIVNTINLNVPFYIKP